MAHEEWSELAELHALGALDGEERSRFDAHLSAGCALCNARVKETFDALTLLPLAITPVAPPPSLKQRLMERIDSESSGYTFIRADQGEWQELVPGVRAKVLHFDQERRRLTALVRMAPGSSYDDHRHTQPEELLVLEGSCYCGGRLLRPGDYHRAEVGTIHLDTRTDEGSLMLVMTALQNEALA